MGRRDFVSRNEFLIEGMVAIDSGWPPGPIWTSLLSALSASVRDRASEA
jgi:hypothetical protein